MKSVATFFCLPLLTAALGCAGGDACSAGAFAGTWPDHGFTGQRIEGRISNICGGGITVSVTDALGTKVPVETQGNPDLAISFTPSAGGNHRIRVVFENSGTSIEREVTVLEDLSSSGFIEIPQACQNVFRTEKGAYLCDEKLIRDGMIVQTFRQGSVFSVAGSVVWQIAGGSIRRFEDTGSGPLVQVPSVDLEGACCIDPKQIAATPDTLLFWSFDLQRVNYVGGALISSGHEKFGLPQSNTYIGPSLLVRDDNFAYSITTQLPTAPTVCIYSLESGGIQRVNWNGPTNEQYDGCQLLKGGYLGVSDGVVWTHGDYWESQSSWRLRAYRPANGELEEIANLNVDPFLALSYGAPDEPYQPYPRGELLLKDRQRDVLTKVWPRIRDRTIVLQFFNRSSWALSGLLWEKQWGPPSWTRVYRP